MLQRYKKFHFLYTLMITFFLIIFVVKFINNNISKLMKKNLNFILIALYNELATTSE